MVKRTHVYWLSCFHYNHLQFEDYVNKRHLVSPPTHSGRWWWRYNFSLSSSDAEKNLKYNNIVKVSLFWRLFIVLVQGRIEIEELHSVVPEQFALGALRELGLLYNLAWVGVWYEDLPQGEGVVSAQHHPVLSHHVNQQLQGGVIVDQGVSPELA